MQERDKAAKEIAKAIGIYDKQHPDFLLAASVENFGEEAFRQLQDLYIRAFVRADANFQAAENNALDVENGGEIVYSKRGYQKVFFKENVFPPFNESQSEAHDLTERWAKSNDTETGERKLISFHKKWYLVEAFDDLKYGYQAMKRLQNRNILGRIRSMEQLPDSNPLRIHLAKMLHCFEQHITLPEEDTVLIQCISTQRVGLFTSWSGCNPKYRERY